MIKYILLSGLLGWAIFQSSPVTIDEPTSKLSYLFMEHNQMNTPEKDANLFKKFCASCHGSSIADFVQRDWLYGNSWNEVNISIAKRHQSLAKASFQAILSKKEIDQLTDHILYGIESATIESFDTEEDWSSILHSQEQSFHLETVASDIGIPWGFDFLPNGDLLIASRKGKIYQKTLNEENKTLKNTPKVKASGQGGLLDVVVHPDFKNNQTIYFSYSKPKGLTESTTAVVKARLLNGELIDQQEILEALPYHSTRLHYGSRLEFDQEGYLYITIGDRFRRDENPQDLTRHAGKIHRLNDDGTIPKDNPFVNQKGALGSIWSYGHRNPQGLVFDKATNKLWETEHAPRGGDEVNIIQKGANYGWPIISYGINYNGSILTELTQKKGMKQPAHYYVPSPGIGGMTIINSDKYPNWKGNLMVGSLRFQYLSRLVVEMGEVIKEERLLENIGRVRSVEMGPDGYLYIGVESPSRIFRLKPI